MQGTTPLLDVDRLVVHLASERGVVKAVDGVSLCIHEGERVALVGESGAGKSVTARSILRLLPVSAVVHTSGGISYRGERISDMSLQELQQIRGREIGMIFQDPSTYLNPTKRVCQHLVEAVRRSTGRTAIAGDPDACLTAVGLDHRAVNTKYPHELSGGMRQRVLIAMALCCGPRVLIADEPTTALDVTTQAQILRTLRELTDKYDVSLLLITHNLGVVATLCDRIYVMYAGQIVESTKTSTFFSGPKHPYSRGLLRSVPGMDGNKVDIGYIPGFAAHAAEMPHGCRFRERCDSKLGYCDHDVPVVDLPDGNVRCWLYSGTGNTAVTE